MENIKFAIEYLTNNSHKMIEDGNNYAAQSVGLAISVLQKEIPKKAEAKHYLFGPPTYTCTSCLIMVNNSNNYCHRCGQKLDWEVNQ